MQYRPVIIAIEIQTIVKKAPVTSILKWRSMFLYSLRISSILSSVNDPLNGIVISRRPIKNNAIHNIVKCGTIQRYLFYGQKNVKRLILKNQMDVNRGTVYLMNSIDASDDRRSYNSWAIRKTKMDVKEFTHGAYGNIRK